VTTTTGRRPRGLTAGAAFVAMAGLLALLWVIEGLDQASGNALDTYGIEPRTDDGLLHIATAPLLHVGWDHVASNSLPFLILGFLVLLDGWVRWVGATVGSVVGSGLLVWLVSPPGSLTLGASGVVFGWLTYVLLRGFFSRSAGQIALAIGIFLLYGGILWGVLPGAVGVSWQGHLGGAIGGALAAWWLHRRPSTAAPARW
jgi:membrane associated rhomboid family serine protease